MHTSPFCENCGAANDRQTTTCHFCGHELYEGKQVLSERVTGSLEENIVLKERYRIDAPVGQGGMGTVYRAHDLELNNRLVAIKEMIANGLNTKEAEEATETFKREAELLAALQHPNLPGIFDHFEEQGRWYLVMSFI